MINYDSIYKEGLHLAGGRIEIEEPSLRISPKKQNPWKPEVLLSRTNWVDGEGTIHELQDMDRDYLQNVLYFIYKNRDRLWLGCDNASLIDTFKDGDEFFQHVIRNSNIWKAIIKELRTPVEGFKFKFTVPGE